MSDFVTPVLLMQTLAAVREAGRIITDAWNKPRSIKYKGPIDLVTETDVAVETFLGKRLREILPEANVLGEEGSPAARPEGTTWIIDPVDGTTNFAHSIPQCGISLALWRNDAVEMGIVYLPAEDELFHAVRGEGAFLNGKEISVTDESDVERALVATGFPYSIRDDIENIMQNMRAVLMAAQGVRRIGSAAADLAYTACGRFEAYYEIRLKPWDLAAGWLLVEEAGGKVTRYDGVTPFDFGKGILASNGKVHEAIAALITDVDD